MTTTSKPSVGFWIIGIVALLWNAMGVNAYLQQAYNTEAFRSQYSEEQLDIIANLPTWYTALFAVAVFGSALGCITMLLRKKVTNLLFQIGLIAVLAQTGFNLFANEGRSYYGSFEYSMLISIPLVALFLVWYAKRATSKGYIK